MFLITFWETVRVFLIFVFFFLIIPTLFMKSSKKAISLLDRFFFGFVSVVLYQIISVHILVLLKLFDVLSITVLSVFAVVMLMKLDKNKEMGISKFFAKLYLIYDTMDAPTHRSKFLSSIQSKAMGSLRLISGAFGNLLKTPVYSAAVFIIFILSMAARMWHSLVHYAYPHLDMYLHLKWIKAIASNDLYLDNKIYPKAMHAVIAFISEVTFSDPYWVLRYLGPVCAGLLVIAIYFLAFKITGNKYLSVFAMAIYGLTINNNILPSQVFRQTATMPQEFGMLFIILGLAFLIDYIKTVSIRYLYCFEACLLIGLMAHSFSGVFLIFWAAVTIVISLMFKKIKLTAAVRLVGVSAAVAALSFAPLVLGLLLGKVFHETSLEMVTDVTGIKISTMSFGKYFSTLVVPDEWIMVPVVACSIGIFIVLCVGKIRSRVPNLNIFMSLVASALAMYLAYNIPNLIDAVKLPELLRKDRTGPFLSLLLPVVAAIFVFYTADLLLLLVKQMSRGAYANLHKWVYTTILVVFIIASVGSGSYTLKTFYKHVEYDQAAEAYIRIKAEFAKNANDTGNWYVVATDPQFAQVKGYGWYEEGYNFAHDYTKEQVTDPKFTFDFPTNTVFIFVEKKPMIYDKPITLEYGEKEIEPLNEDPFMQFYQDGDNRAVMEGHLWMLAEAYASTHSGVSIYYEDNDFKIYRITTGNI